MLKLYFTIFLSFMLCNISSARIVQVSTATNFNNACVNALPGDTVELANGIYNTNTSITMFNSGTSEQPILIRAQNIGMAELTLNTYFDLRQCAYITIQGFLFTSTNVTVIKLQACNNIRITRNMFRLNETTSLKWVLIGGVWNNPNALSHHNRIDHNLFENKTQAGNCITIDGSGDPTYLSSQYDRIDHNYFRNVGPRIANGMETIRIGWSEMSMSSGFTTVEYNLFENCDGDPEIISVKTCDNLIRYNTFNSCQGTLCLRHGNRSTVEGNYFFGRNKSGTGGIRVYGGYHKIFNNYFEGLTGIIWDAALTLTNGDADSSSTSYSKHFRPVNNTIAYNSFVNNLHNIEIGYTNNGSYTKAPSNNKIVNNIVEGSSYELIKIYTQPLNMLWASNIMYPKDSAILGITASYSQIKQINPLLNLVDTLWFVSSISPAIDSSTGVYDFVLYDFNGQLRKLTKDIGADEYSNDPALRRPLTLNDVGPNAVEPSIKLSLKAIIEGLYNTTTTVSDSINVELCNDSAPHACADQVKVILNSDGIAVADFFDAQDTHPFYIVIKHRNGLETWSSSSQDFSGGIGTFDFTESQNQAFGNNLILKGTKWCLYSGDVNGDGVIDLSDVAAIDIDNLNFVTGYTVTDVNGDGLIDLSDLSIVDTNNLNFVSKVTP